MAKLVVFVVLVVVVVDLVGCDWLVCDETDENRKPDGFDDILPKFLRNTTKAR